MNYWIFQSVPKRYDLRERLLEGVEVTWYATRYRNRMLVGDVVFFWLAGPPDIRGIYGWGKLTSTPYRKDAWRSHGVDVRFEKRLKAHLSVTEIRSVPDLQDLLILRSAQATNFLLSSQLDFIHCDRSSGVT